MVSDGSGDENSSGMYSKDDMYINVQSAFTSSVIEQNVINKKFLQLQNEGGICEGAAEVCSSVLGDPDKDSELNSDTLTSSSTINLSPPQFPITIKSFDSECERPCNILLAKTI